jgi:aminopeptidase-like protein
MSGEGASRGAGSEMFGLVERLFPICRSITGEGLRQTLRLLQELIPLEIREVPSGTQVFDWTVPKEWNIRDAFIKDLAGRRVVDFAQSNLHVVGYSVPFRGRMSLEELRSRLHTLPESPDWIPYKTSYYNPDWGFCLSQRTLDALPEGEYDVEIDASLEDGSLSYGELLVEGKVEDEVLISTHVCHPSLCNDNLSGVAVSAFLARHLLVRRPRLSYRFLFLPGTIGAITWLALNQDSVGRIKHGLVLSCLGDKGTFTYKRSRRGSAVVDRAVAHLLRHSKSAFEIRDFSPYGYDERQYCSPGFDLPVGCLTRTPWGEYPEYHTSADNLSFLRPGALGESLELCLAVVDALDHDRIYLRANPNCEPRLGVRGLWKGSAGHKGPGREDMALLWVLNLTDGENSLLDISERAAMPFSMIQAAAEELEEHGLIQLLGDEVL